MILSLLGSLIFKILACCKKKTYLNKICPFIIYYYFLNVFFQTLKLADFEIKEKEEFNLEARLQDIIGLDDVKNYIRALAAKIRVNKEREKLGIANNNVQTQKINIAFDITNCFA